MRFFSTLYRTLIDALFPLSAAEEQIMSYSPEQAYLELPKAPKYTENIPNCYSLFAYKDERVAKLIWSIKYKKSKHAVEIGGYALWNALKNKAERIEHSLFVLIPMPITERRRKERGYNQCELLVDEIEHLDTQRHFNIRKDILVRTHHADRHTLKGRSERLEDAKGIFGVTETIAEIDKEIPVVIVDDVITTGSTIKEAMETLQKSGFKTVYGLSIAH